MHGSAIVPAIYPVFVAPPVAAGSLPCALVGVCERLFPSS
jgi:hypothetical protein